MTAAALAAGPARTAALVSAWLALDWLVRTHAPCFLNLAGFTEAADELETLPTILDLNTCGLAVVCATLTDAHARAWRAGEASLCPRSAFATADAAGAVEAWCAVSRELPPDAVHIAQLARATAGHAAAAASEAGLCLTALVPRLRAELALVLDLAPKWIPEAPAAAEEVIA